MFFFLTAGRFVIIVKATLVECCSVRWGCVVYVKLTVLDSCEDFIHEHDRGCLLFVGWCSAIRVSALKPRRWGLFDDHNVTTKRLVSSALPRLSPAFGSGEVRPVVRTWFTSSTVNTVLTLLCYVCRWAWLLFWASLGKLVTTEIVDILDELARWESSRCERICFKAFSSVVACWSRTPSYLVIWMVVCRCRLFQCYYWSRIRWEDNSGLLNLTLGPLHAPWWSRLVTRHEAWWQIRRNCLYSAWRATCLPRRRCCRCCMSPRSLTRSPSLTRGFYHRGLGRSVERRFSFSSCLGRFIHRWHAVSNF